MYDFDLRGIFYLACVGLVAIAVFVVWWLLWFLFNHVRLA